MSIDWSQLTRFLVSPFLARWYGIVGGILFLTYITLYILAHRFPKLNFIYRSRYAKITIFAALLIPLALGNIFIPSPELISPPAPLFTHLDINPNKPLTLIFNRPVSPNLIPVLTPSISGRWKYQSGAYGLFFYDRLIFTPDQQVAPDTDITISLRHILPIAWVTLDQQNQYLFVDPAIGSVIPDVTLASLATNEPLKLQDAQPAPDTSDVDSETPLVFTFNQPVATASALSAISLTPLASYSAVVDAASLTINPQPSWSFTTSYTLTISSDLKTPTHLHLTEPYTYHFRTAAESFRLPVPLYKQHYTFTCFAAASQMVLAYRGVKVTELGFENEIGYDKTPRDYVKNVWGDPSVGIVGTYNGSGAGGYGVHWDPVAKAIAKYTPVEIKHDWNIPDLLQTVKAGNPVMLWWVNGVWPAKELYWKNAQGQEIRAVNGMHVEVVTGWVGSINHPRYITTNDPWRGYRRYTPETFLELWHWFNNTAVIVKNK